jgi:hypothetical protein
MPASKRPTNGPAASARALAQTAAGAEACAEKPKRVDFDAAHAREFNKKEGITDYVSRMKQRLGQSKASPAPAAPVSTKKTTIAAPSSLGIPSSLLQKKRKGPEDSEKENDLAQNGAVTRALLGGLLQPAAKRARAGTAAGGTVSQPTTPLAARAGYRLVMGEEASMADQRKRRMSYTPHRGPLPAYPDSSAVTAKAVVSSPARAMVSPMRPVGSRILQRSLTANLLDEEAVLAEVHSTPSKKRKVEVEQQQDPSTIVAEVAVAIAEAHELGEAIAAVVASGESASVEPHGEDEEEATRTMATTKREGWRSVERRNGPRPDAQRRHTVSNRHILALLAESQ